jgi:hypothetical protein
VVRQSLSTWRAALKSVAGVYLVADELMALLKQNGDTHAKHFQFSILEICDVKASPNEVWVRESHWKNALLSRKFGYNAN